jgi:plastocyanin
MPLPRAPIAALAALLLVGPLAAGCSNRQSPSNKRAHTGTGVAAPVNGVQQITISTGVDLRFHPSTIVVHRGEVRIVLKNKASNGGGPPHNIQFAGLPGADVPLTYVGESQSVTFMAPGPGTYNFVCTIHANQGQSGKLIVK